MAKVRDERGHEIEGRSVVNETQAVAREHWDAVKSPSVKRERAQARLEVRATLGPADQLKRLDKRLGVGEGERKERARLHALIVEKK